MTRSVCCKCGKTNTPKMRIVRLNSGFPEFLWYGVCYECSTSSVADSHDLFFSNNISLVLMEFYKKVRKRREKM